MGNRSSTRSRLKSWRMSIRTKQKTIDQMKPSKEETIDETTGHISLHQNQQTFQSEDSLCTIQENETKIFAEIARRLSPEQCHVLGVQLGLATNVLLDLEKDCNVYHYGRQFKIIRMLEKWKEKENPDPNQLVSLLAIALTTIDRIDVADTIQKKFHNGNHYSLNDLMKNIQEVLKNLFKDLTLPTSVWLQKKRLPLEKLFVELTMETKNMLGEEEERRIKKEEIFQETETGIPRRILIEGQPGYGKTTLVAKLLSDWAKGENYISGRFDLVFVIPLRNYTGNYSKHFLKHCERVKGRDHEKLHVIESINERVLLLLDGLDEIPTKGMQNLFRLLKGDDYPQMTVIVTCRVGYVRIETKSDDIFEGMQIKHFGENSVWDKRVKIKGISPARRIDFLQKYLNINKEELRTKLFETNLVLSDLYECPLFLLLLAVLIQEKDIKPIKTKTELYKTIFNFVLNRGLEKFKGKAKEVDVFDLQTESDEFSYRQLLHNFGRLCLEKIKTHSLIFQENELLKCSGGNGDENLILKLGFLSKQISFFNYEEKEHYEPIHKSFVEFCAAFFLSSSNKIEGEIQELMIKFNIWPQKDQLLFPFLGGFLLSRTFRLFNALSPYKSIISIFNDGDRFKSSLYNVENILLEIPQEEKIFKSLQNFTLCSCQRVINEEPVHTWFICLMNNCKERGKDICLKIPRQLHIINQLSDDIRINTIRAYVKRDEIKLKGGTIQCQNLIISLNVGIHKEAASVLKEITSKVKADKIWLKFSHAYGELLSSTRDNFFHFFNVLTDDLNRFNFYHWLFSNITPSVFACISPFIQTLIKQKKIEYGVKILFAKETINDSLREEFSSFEEAVSKSHLKSFGVDNSFNRESIPLPVHFFVNDKRMQFMILKGLFGPTDSDELKSISIEHFNCIDLRVEKKNSLTKLLFKMKNIKRLSCNSDLISDLGVCDSISEWKGFETIDRLDIQTNTSVDEKSFLKGVALFTKVRELSFIDLTDRKFLFEVISLLPSLRRIRYSYDNFLMKFLQKLLALKEENGERQLCFDDLEIDLDSVFYPIFSSMDVIKYVETCLFNYVFLKFSMLSSNIMHLEFLIRYFVSKEEFKISSQWIQESSKRIIRSASYCNAEVIYDETPELKHHLSICLNNF